jgi:WD repeat-containing protein 81
LPLVDDNVRQEKVSEQLIHLPKDYNPTSILLQVETGHVFLNKTCHKVYEPRMLFVDSNQYQKQIVVMARIKEQQILGCLIVEIFLAEKFRSIWKVEKISFDNRLSASLSIIKTLPNVLPKCIQNAVMLLLRIDAIPKSYNIDFAENVNAIGK